MAGTITTGSISRLLQEGIYAIFGDTYNERAQVWSQIFDEKMSEKAFELDVQLEGYGLARVKPQGQELSFDSKRQGFTPKYIHATIGLAFSATREAIEDDLYDTMLGDASSLGRSMRVTREVVTHAIINNGFNTAFVMPDGDGEPLFSTSHPFGPTQSGTYSNRLAVNAAMSEAAIEDLLIQIDRETDARDKPINLQALRLFVPSELMFEAQRILMSVLQNDTANNAVNSINSMNSIRDNWLSSVYLTSPTAWFIKTDCPQGLCSYTRRALEFGEDNSFTTENGRFKSTERYSQGWTDPRGVYAGNE